MGTSSLANGTEHIYLLLLLKYKDFRNSINNYQELLQQNDYYEALFLLCSLILNIMLVAHIYACVWYAIGSSKGNSWIEKSVKINSSWQDLYISSIYFSLATMITVGYGDISPQTQSEAVWCIFGMLFGSMLFGYTMNKVGEILKNMNKSKSELREKLKIINRYMMRKGVEYDLQVRVRKYLEYEAIDGSHEAGNDEKTLNELPLSLREEVLLQSNGSVLKLFPMFCENFSETVLRKMIHIMKPCRFTPEEIIFEVSLSRFANLIDCSPFFKQTKEEEHVEQDVYLIIKGEVEILSSCQRRDEKPLVLKVVGKGESFGEISFFTEMTRKFSARSLNFCTAFSIKREDFLDILKNEPEDYAVYCMIRDNILLYENYKKLHISCYSCGHDTHILSKCPYVNLSVIKDIVIKKHLHSVGQKRGKSKRNKTRKLLKFNTLKHQRQISSSAFPFLEEGEEEDVEREKAIQSPSDDMRVPNEDGTSSPKLQKIYEDCNVEDDQIEMKYLDSSPSIRTPQQDNLNYNFNMEQEKKNNTGMFSFQQKLSENRIDPISINSRVLSLTSFENEKGDLGNPSPGFKALGPRKNTNTSTHNEELVFNFKNVGRFESLDQIPKNGTLKFDPSQSQAREIENFSRSIFQRYQLRHNTNKSAVTMSNSEFDLMTDKGAGERDEYSKDPLFIGLPKEYPREYSMREGPTPSDFGRSLTKKTNDSRTKTSKSAVTGKTNKTQNTNNKKALPGLKDEQKLFMLEMDKCKAFTCYFPQNNVESVISKIDSKSKHKLVRTAKYENASPNRTLLNSSPTSAIKPGRGRATITRRNFFTKREISMAAIPEIQMHFTKLGSMDSKLSKRTKKSLKGEKK